MSLRFGQKVRKDVLACFKKCGGTVKYPFRVDPDALKGREEICFGDCLNLNFEKGPYLRELGTISDEVIPKKFIWAHSLWEKIVCFSELMVWCFNFFP